MQQFIQFSRRQIAGHGAVRSGSEGAYRLAQVYRAQGFRVDQIDPTTDIHGQSPDVALLLHRGRDSVLVHAYCSGDVLITQHAVQHLAGALFDACAISAVLIGRVGFTAGARSAAARLGQIALLEGPALQAMTGGAEADAWESLAPPVPAQVARPRDMTRPAWPVRAAIGMTGVALAATMAFASLPSLRGDVQQLLMKPKVSTAAIALPALADEPWLSPAQSRSGDLALRVAEGPAVATHADATAPRL